MIGKYCREYRKNKGVTLREVEGSDFIKSLSAFESGRSSNISHFFKYLELANNHGELHTFITGAIHAMKQELNNEQH